ncbi:MAG: hypothetical protein R3C25_09000 [Hyphomonadaceae bacterium]
MTQRDQTDAQFLKSLSLEVLALGKHRIAALGEQKGAYVPPTLKFDIFDAKDEGVVSEAIDKVLADLGEEFTYDAVITHPVVVDMIDRNPSARDALESRLRNQFAQDNDGPRANYVVHGVITTIAAVKAYDIITDKASKKLRDEPANNEHWRAVADANPSDLFERLNPVSGE